MVLVIVPLPLAVTEEKGPNTALETAAEEDTAAAEDAAAADDAAAAEDRVVGELARGACGFCERQWVI